MLTNLLFIQCVVFLVMIVLVNECSGRVKYVGSGARTLNNLEGIFSLEDNEFSKNITENKASDSEAKQIYRKDNKTSMEMSRNLYHNVSSKIYNEQLLEKISIDRRSSKNKKTEAKNLEIPKNSMATKNMRRSKGFFGHDGIFALPKVLNFFPVGGERECQPEAYKVARAGICLNPYDCRQRDGVAGGDCAHGLGVCCVFEISCGGVAANNLTYFMSPGFPELWPGDRDCSITIEKAFAGIMQLRIDFVHFTIGQPNRLTGECDEDAMVLGEGKDNFTICGQNHGQHIYYTLPTASVKREAGELPTIKSTKLSIRMRGGEMPRLWLLRIAQLPLVNSAPHNCLQYYTTNNGTIKTFNYASNGRYLASQEYRACVRKNAGQCAIRYTACDSRSFRIGGGADFVDYYNAPEDSSMQDEEEGSGMDPMIMTNMIPSSPPPPARQPPKTFMETIWSYIWPSWLWNQGRSRTLSWRWSPYTQHYKSSPENDDFRYYGYGNFGNGLHGFGRQRCKDRITIPCESEYFVSGSSYGSGVCDPHHCGGSFCPGQSHAHCRVETSISPFAVSVHFGPPREKRNPEENIGACLRYQQVPCES